MQDLSYCNIKGGIEKEQETANSYVINFPGDYCFPLIMGNGIKNGKTNTPSFTRIGKSRQVDFYNYLGKIIYRHAELVNKPKEVCFISWDSSRELIQNLKLKKDYVSFSVPYVPETGANYVIGVKDENGVIMWSWHIWLWGRKLEDQKIGKYELLNTNLATKETASGELRSWYYQWGRKDPFNFLIQKTKKSIVLNKKDKNIEYYIQNPNILFYKLFLVSNRSVSMDNLWNANCLRAGEDVEVVKTIYDPCPRGYTVPRGVVFSKLLRDVCYCYNSENKFTGIKIKDIYFPALGALYGEDIERVSAGLYWTSLPDSDFNAACFEFIEDDIYSDEICQRMLACSIRPQKEEQTKILNNV